MKNRCVPQPLLILAALAAAFSFVLAAHAATPGAQDTTFATGPEADGSTYALALQGNGQVLVGGAFANFRGVARNGIARLNADGTLDTFSPGLAVTGSNGAPSVRALALQTNGQVIATGSFTVLGQPANGGVVRLNADGSLDGNFNAGSGVVDDGDAVGSGLALAVLPNGQILVGGGFLSFDGVQTAGLVRLNANGSVDTSFNPGGAGISGNGYGFNGGDVASIAVLANGQIYIGGHFAAYDGQQAESVARLNADGTLDRTFNVGEGAATGINAVAVQADGRILAGGDDNFDSVTVPFIVRLNTDGSLDTSYDPEQGVTIDGVDAILIQPDGSALVGGVVYSQGGLVDSPGDGLLRILSNGTQDTSFVSGGSALEVQALALQPDGNALIAANVYALSGPATGDVYRVFDLSLTPTVSIAPGVALTNENSGSPATFILTLSAAQSADLIVDYTVKGSAQAGFNYETLNGHAKIKAGKTTKTIKVNPYNQGIGGGGKVAVKIVLENGTGYTLGTSNTAKVKIVEND